MKKLITLMIITTLNANAMSAETWVLERERGEACRYASQVHEQMLAMRALDRNAEKLADRAIAAHKAAVKREAALASLQRAEQVLADKRVGIAEYQQVDYVVDSSNREVEARLK